jgi:hypothetical protein
MKAIITDMARGHITLSVDGRSIRVTGEAFLRGYGSPDFLAYSSDLVKWDDGERLTNEVREQVLKALLEAARERNILVELEPYLPLP